MPSSLAAVLAVAGIAAMLLLNRDTQTRNSAALWVPTAWLLISGSRHVSEWLGVAPSPEPLQYLEGSPLDRNIYAALIAAGVLVLLRRGRRASLWRGNALILLFVAYCAVSITWSDFPAVAFKRWIKSLGDYVMVMILLTEDDWKSAVKQVLATVGIILLPLSVLLIKYYPSLGRAYALRGEGTQYFIGVAADKNMLGMSCMVFGVAAAWRVLEAWNDPHHERLRTYVVHGTLLAIAVWLLRISNSMTSLACFVLTSCLIAAHALSSLARKRWVLNLSVGAIALLCALVLFFDVGSDLLVGLDRNPTLTGRTDIWRGLLEVPINPIVGTGFESFWLGERLERVWSEFSLCCVNEAHNGYLEMYLNLGWIGVAFLAALLWRAYRNVLDTISGDPEMGRLLLGYFVVVVIYNFTEAAVRSTALVWIGFLIVTMAGFSNPTDSTDRTGD
jgi:exopolysaccharide production protein ExoQ